MLSSLANYLLGGNISGAQGSRQGSNNETPETHPVMARLSQVEIEGDDWILIDRTGTFNERDKRSFPKGISRNSNIYIYIFCICIYTYICMYIDETHIEIKSCSPTASHTPREAFCPLRV